MQSRVYSNTWNTNTTNSGAPMRLQQPSDPAKHKSSSRNHEDRCNRRNDVQGTSSKCRKAAKERGVLREDLRLRDKGRWWGGEKDATCAVEIATYNGLVITHRGCNERHHQHERSRV